MSDFPGNASAGSGSDPRSERGLRLRFPKAARLTRATAFARVKKYGRSFPGRLLVLGVLAEAEVNPETGSRVGFVTSRRVGGAVLRNTVRRHLREAVRHTRLQLRTGCWIVVIARNYAARATGRELATEWLKLARRAGILLPVAPATPPIPPASPNQP